MCNQRQRFLRLEELAGFTRLQLMHIFVLEMVSVWRYAQDFLCKILRCGSSTQPESMEQELLSRRAAVERVVI